MKKQIIKLIVCVVAVAVIAVLSVLCQQQKKHIQTLKVQVKEQSAVIDSLLNRRMTVFDVKLNVTDRSRNIIHGRYNKGTISMPQERVYELKIDSTKITVK